MNKPKTITQVAIILGFALIIALIVNSVNPKGISILDDGERYDKDVKEKSLKDVTPNVNDTTNNNKPKTLDKPANISKEGFVKPQFIALDLAKSFFGQGALFIDARLKVQYDSGHVKGSINLPYQEFAAKSKEEKLEILKKYNKEGTIVCYCSGGECEVSIDLAYEIAKIGFNYVNIYRGGYKEWENGGNPVEK
ncbi:MAG TPA: rhodanese-like domain-containing protein [Ignavibacteria bacterium]|jgi:rhodanese-related sulfurtransferase